MNICFLQGKIISKIDFNFILNSKNISVATFKLQLKNNSIINVKAYNYLADYCFSSFVKGDIIAIHGYLSDKMELIVETIE